MGIYDTHAQWYDAIYDDLGHDAPADVDALFLLLDERGVRPASVLDVACGTGRHVPSFSERVDLVVGTDASEDMLKVAIDRSPHVEFVKADFRTMDLQRRFDLVTCLFSSVGHVADEAELRQAIAAMSTHVEHDGALIIEAWLTPEEAKPEGARQAVMVPVADGHVARLARSYLDGDAVVIEFVWAVATAHFADCELERHRMSLFSEQQYVGAMRACGLEPEWISPSPLTSGRAIAMGRNQ